MEKQVETNLIGMKEAAKLAGMNRPNFYYYVKEGRSPNFSRINDAYVFDRDEVLAWKPDYRKPGARRKIKEI